MRLPEWEEQAERRIGTLEGKMDKLLDPEKGIYPKMDKIKGDLARWAIAILTGLIGNMTMLIIILKSHN